MLFLRLFPTETRMKGLRKTIQESIIRSEEVKEYYSVPAEVEAQSMGVRRTLIKGNVKLAWELIADDKFALGVLTPLDKVRVRAKLTELASAALNDSATRSLNGIDAIVVMEQNGERLIFELTDVRLPFSVKATIYGRVILYKSGPFRFVLDSRDESFQIAELYTN